MSRGSALPHPMTAADVLAEHQATPQVSFSVLVGALRAANACGACGKTRVVLNISGHGRPFRAERVSPATHCACEGGPAYVAPAMTTAEVCEHCGEERSRAEFYSEPCRGDAQADGVPGPVQGEHSFVRVAIDPPALGDDT